VLEERLRIKAVIFDYGCVLCLDQPAEDRARIEALAGVEHGERMWEAYWELRPAHDRGLTTGAEFWDGVARRLGRSWDADLRARLIEADVASWSHPNQRMIAWLETLAGEGFLVGLLSNAPFECRDAILGTPWARSLAHATFSCDVRSLKPEQEIYRHCLAGLGVEAGSALFIDDRAVNVEGAERVGLRALRFVDAGELGAELAGINGLPPVPI
jgi:putative hydrolase of the HAD superfamily